MTFQTAVLSTETSDFLKQIKFFKSFRSDSVLMRAVVWQHNSPGLVLAHVTGKIVCDLALKVIMRVWIDLHKTSAKQVHVLSEIFKTNQKLLQT